MGTLRDAGHDVRLCSPLPTDVPPDVALTAYRIVQESLTNALRHTPRAAVDLDLEREQGALRVTVRNRLPALPSRADQEPSGATGLVSGGHGLPGMRERALIAGGSLEAGPRGREWVVQALIPAPDLGGTDPSQPAGATSRASVEAW